MNFSIKKLMPNFEIIKTKKGYVYFSLKLALSMSALVLLSFGIPWEEVYRKSLDIDFSFLMLGFFLLFTCTFLAAFRWSIFLKAFGYKIRYGDVWVTLMIGSAFDQAFLTSSGDVYRSVSVATRFASSTRAVASVVLDRFAGIAGLTLIMILGLPQMIEWGFTEATVAIFCGVLILGLSILFFLTRIINWSTSRFRKILTPLMKALQTAGDASLTIKNLNLALLVTVLIHLLVVFSFSSILLALKLPIPIIELIAIIPAAILFSLLPISVGGWGVREGAIVYGLSFISVDSVDALMASVFYGLGLVSLGFLGCFFLFFRINSKPEG